MSLISRIDDACREIRHVQSGVSTSSEAYALLGAAIANLDEAVWALQEEVDEL